MNRQWPIGGVAAEVAEFNDRVPVGASVAYWPGFRIGEGVPSTTRSRAWLLGDHTPVVMVEGYGGAIALTHGEATPAPVPLDEKGGE